MSDQITPEEQHALLQESINVIKQETQLMKKSLETKGKLMDALKHASNFLTELRTSQLTPKQYYELYILIFDSLNLLANYLKDNHPHHHLADLYELVQYAGNIVPRLYLMITVGTVYMSIPDAPIKEIMKDMIEMCRGVQYPIRGLFLRYYLSQRTKSLLSENQDSIQFVITNFIEMNKLWVRLQHQGPSKDRLKRNKEREELKILVGSNLVRLSQLQNDKEYYKNFILPTVLEQIVQCKDILAQEYLLDVVIQVFPDEFHLYTLDEYLDIIKDLNPNVSIKKVLITLIDRLTDFAKREDLTDLEKLTIKETGIDEEQIESQQEETTEKSEEADEQPVEQSEGESKSENDGETNGSSSFSINLFEKFWYYINQLEQSRELSIEEISSLLESISKLTLTYYSNNFENIDLILKFAIEKLKELSNDQTKNDFDQTFKNLLLAPINNYENLLDLLKLTNYIELLNLESLKIQKIVSLEILNKILSNGIRLKTLESVNGIMSLLRVIIESKDQTSSTSSNTDQESLEFITEQEKLSKIIHLIGNKNPIIHGKLLTSCKNYLSKGNIKFTYPSIFFNTLKLIRKNNLEENQNSLFKFISRIINDLYRLGLNDLSFKLNLSSAIIADQIKFEDISYEFFVQSFTIYEESISDSRSQFQSIVAIAGALQQCRNFNKENYDNLITKTALHGSKLLKKPDQCRSVYLASHLWWGVEIPSLGEEEGITEFYRDGKRVLECLQRSLRVADACMDSSVSIELFVEILNRCLYYFIHGSESITIKYINGLIELIQTNLDSISNENGAINENPKKHFQRTLEYIDSQKEIDERFQLITW
ncbi:Vacuolar protein sorting-associated protein [Wickerhamomyces ciferrii]|uniref:Vacuolar protein sorting-associated protein 35 n=1 Tax=Wickerhamomyces ciferrii (strain ATCC 14091 / BCRC 22168 / CBS 111 / JCM 3599 / NBRC 0793 / NRRL Y-1031 F-60-10) TaxID=1206466 RepID=K0KSK0_WICCF|nr:Vacuolar protein sorting-associated protein [Wickerhamomyces ciferrii]CCH45022.1 Vacuolar protein sorting-associated protein [Wickerhamomyces ciferrii]